MQPRSPLLRRVHHRRLDRLLAAHAYSNAAPFTPSSAAISPLPPRLISLRTATFSSLQNHRRDPRRKNLPRPPLARLARTVLPEMSANVRPGRDNWKKPYAPLLRIRRRPRRRSLRPRRLARSPNPPPSPSLRKKSSAAATANRPKNSPSACYYPSQRDGVQPAPTRFTFPSSRNARPKPPWRILPRLRGTTRPR